MANQQCSSAGAPTRTHWRPRPLDRRDFLKLLSAAGAASTLGSAEDIFAVSRLSGDYRPGRIVNEYSAFLPGERAALAEPPKVSAIDEKGAAASHGGSSRPIAHG